jgi:hypothetical protein
MLLVAVCPRLSSINPLEVYRSLGTWLGRSFPHTPFDMWNRLLMAACSNRFTCCLHPNPSLLKTFKSSCLCAIMHEPHVLSIKAALHSAPATLGGGGDGNHQAPRVLIYIYIYCVRCVPTTVNAMSSQWHLSIRRNDFRVRTDPHSVRSHMSDSGISKHELQKFLNGILCLKL